WVHGWVLRPLQRRSGLVAGHPNSTATPERKVCRFTQLDSAAKSLSTRPGSVPSAAWIVTWQRIVSNPTGTARSTTTVPRTSTTALTSPSSATRVIASRFAVMRMVESRHVASAAHSSGVLLELPARGHVRRRGTPLREMEYSGSEYQRWPVMSRTARVVSPHRRLSLAPEMAMWNRRPRDGGIYRSDQGCPYPSLL